MKASILSLAAAVAAVSAASNDTMITSTILTTELYTITSCAPTVTNCPVGKVTETVKTTTTICPITATYPPAPPTTPVTKTLPPKGPVTSTYYSTAVYTVTSCAPTVTNCPYGSKTSTVYTSTVICNDLEKCGSKTLPPPVSTSVPVCPGGPNCPYTKSTTAGSLTTIPPPVSTSVPYCPTAITSYITVTAYPCPGPNCATNTVPAVPATTPYVCPGSPYCPATTPATTAYGTGVSTGGKVYPTSTPVPFISGASAQKAGGFMVALGAVVAALL
ncbi:hypothetical protein BGZ60DRAFT_436405 [Tricladium varicosporioides]|nr:hypothetical protein BGZ60DRAFT_436405 [Hymenoscyphus varicosporioides]